jgi:hypothetical protein
MNWAMLPKASKAVLPVIAAHCNEAGDSFPGERTVAVLSGLTDKIARAGIQGLIGFPGFHLSHYVTKQGRRSKRFRIEFPPEREKDRYFFFHKCIFEGGNWQKIKPVSQALYPVMGYFAYFDLDLYLELKESAEESFSESEFGEFYKNREWDVCKAEIDVMANYAGISRPSVYTALKDLEDCFLIKDQGYDYEGARRWIVFIIPLKIYRQDCLNKVIMKKYAHERECKNSTGHHVKKRERSLKKRHSKKHGAVKNLPTK